MPLYRNTRTGDIIRASKFYVLAFGDGAFESVPEDAEVEVEKAVTETSAHSESSNNNKPAEKTHKPPVKVSHDKHKKGGK